MQKKHGGGTKEKIAEIGRTNHGLTVDDGVLTFDGHSDAIFGHNGAIFGNNDAIFGHNGAIFGNNDAIFGHNDAVTRHNDTKSNDGLCNRKAGSIDLFDGISIDLESNHGAKR